MLTEYIRDVISALDIARCLTSRCACYIRRFSCDGLIKKNTERRETETGKIGEIEGVIGLAVDGGLEACVKPGALTAGFKGEGKGYGLESGLYFIF